MISFWEQQSFTQYDHIVIGAGIVGLSTAIELKERFPEASVLVLERGLLPTGASSRNAGFACMGSVTELLDDLQTMSPAEVATLFADRKKGLERLRNRLGDAAMDYAEQGSFELITQQELTALDRIEELNTLLSSITGKSAFRLANDKIAAFGFARHHVHALIENTCEGELNTGKMLLALTRYALRCGVELKTGAEVLRMEERSHDVVVVVADPLRKEELLLHARKLVLCTNAFTPTLLPDVPVIPGRGQVLITQPIPGLRFKGIFHLDKGYFYFRELAGRILIGGGRNLDLEGEATTDLALHETIQLALERKLHDVVIPNTHFLVEQRWSGIMAFGPNKQPIVRAFSDKVFGAFRMGGMGVALGSKVAMEVADLVLERS